MPKNSLNSFWRKLFPKKDEPKEDTVMRVKRVVKALGKRSLEYEVKARDQRIYATRCVREGDKAGARLHVRKRLRYLRKANLVEQEIDLMERGIESIRQARSEVDVVGALRAVTDELNKIRETASPEIAQEVMLETQALIEQAEATEEILGLGLEEDIMETDVDAELTEIETQVALEEVGGLPEPLHEKWQEAETSEEKRERIRKELKKMKELVTD